MGFDKSKLMDEQFTLGSLSADVRTLQQEMRLVRSDVVAIRTRLDEQKGGWRMLAGLTATAAAMGAALTELLQWVLRK